MKKYILYCIVILLFTAAKVGAQDSYNERARKYIEQYYPLAIAEQKNSGIPASVTLGQGILETEAGESELMTEANNHFGIKCNNNWDGPTFTHTDDAPNECFKKYSCAAESFRDHSQHLKRNARYSPLFALSLTDYASWAVCLKKCGYATNPHYAQRLIKIIEDFKLQQYTYSGMDTSFLGNNPAPVAAKKVADTPLVAKSEAEQMPVAIVANPVTADSNKEVYSETAFAGFEPNEDSVKMVVVNGLKAFYAHKNEMLLTYAVKFNVRYPHLLEINDLKDGPVPFDMYVYLEKKLTSGTHDKHRVAQGESLLMIAQEEGMQLKKLMSLNLLNPGTEPTEGTILELQKPVIQQPEAKPGEVTAHKTNSIVTGATPDNGSNNDYIAIAHPKPAEGTPPPHDSAKAAPTAEPKTEHIASRTLRSTNDNDYIVIDKSNPAASGETKAIPAVYHPDENTAQADAEKKRADQAKKDELSKREELEKLKATLDKVVYSDDSKLPAEKPSYPKKEPVAASASSGAGRYYTIKKGDTAFSIAKRNNITVDQLYQWNNIDAGGVKVGKTIQVKE
jgi:LysM repeat protein